MSNELTPEVVEEDESKPVERSDYADLIEDFLSSKSEKTMQAYRRDLEDFAGWCGVEDPEAALRELLSLDSGSANRLVVKFKNDLQNERELAPATVNRKLAALRSIVDGANKFGYVEWKLNVDNVESKAKRDVSGPPLSKFKELIQLVKDREDEKGARDYAILRLLYDRGLRRNEIVSLDFEHVKLGEGKLSVKRKGRHQREILTIPKQTIEALSAWIKVRGEKPGPLFYNFNRAEEDNGRLTGSGIYRMLRYYGEKVGLDQLHPHSIRHLSGTSVARETNGNIVAVAEFLGHSDTSTAQDYIDAVEDVGGRAAQKIAANV